MLKITTILLIFNFTGPEPDIKRANAVFTSRDECRLVAAVVKKELNMLRPGSKVVCAPRAGSR
ncbi:hypothetical protein SAMN05216358_0083 [Rhizobium sp. AN5]|uniref:hypothetical protein n=1 Tax=Rhizobium sp. AN5 TaxID=1855304 RepID=UPI000BC65C57|nr:hypothetical protein [Rhizobium sp. AN5]SOC90064.1 hypothetical protein SAMN05216358_0083 [Rhizobium sp. AN5]